MPVLGAILYAKVLDLMKVPLPRFNIAFIRFQVLTFRDNLITRRTPDNKQMETDESPCQAASMGIVRG